MAHVSLDRISKTYDGTIAAVRDVSFDVGDGEFVVLVGPSGCGKTTLLRMIAGLEEITSGELQIDGRRMNEVTPKDRDIAMVFQNYALYPHKTVYENMAFSLRLRHVARPDIERRVREAAAILGIEPLLDRKPKALSGGQRQRVAVGRAIVRHPKVFLFDEPLSNLDAQLRGQMRTELLKIHRRLGATMIYVTHDQTEAMTLGNRIVVLKDGQIEQCDAPMTIYGAPETMFVAEFIGSPSINFLRGRIERRDGAAVFFAAGEGLRVPLPERTGTIADVVLGIRPEDVAVGGVGDAHALATVDVVELLGNEMLVSLTTDSGTLTARCAAELGRLNAGARVGVRLAAERAHLFDPATARRIP